jgi:ribosomal-protein-alanine N-acetyltransferase
LGIAFLNEPSTVIGTICFWNLKPEHYRGEIGYMLHPDHWRKGIMKEAINAVVNYGFTVLGYTALKHCLIRKISHRHPYWKVQGL